MQDFIREIRQIHDATILLCTHDLDEAEALADRVGILDDGNLLSTPVETIKRRYNADTLEQAFFAATGKAFEDESARTRSNARRSGSPPPRADRARRCLRAERLLVKRYIWWDVAFFLWTIARTP